MVTHKSLQIGSSIVCGEKTFSNIGLIHESTIYDSGYKLKSTTIYEEFYTAYTY